jgi:hypothetical protein
VSRFVDRGAVTAAWVGVGMAVTIGVSFILVIPIEVVYTGIIAPGFPIAWLAGLTIGYYANTRSNRQGGPWGRILANAALAGAATAITFALLFLGIKALFFTVDNGYRDASSGGPLACTTGADCVYQRYVELQPEVLEAAGVTTVEEFTTLYWSQQLSTAGGLAIATFLASIAGGAVFRITNGTKQEDAPGTTAGA